MISFLRDDERDQLLRERAEWEGRAQERALRIADLEAALRGVLESGWSRSHVALVKRESARLILAARNAFHKETQQ